MRVGGGEKTRHRAAFGNTENVGAFDADIIHHCANVISTLLQRRHFHRSIGKARAAFIEANKAAELAEALEEKRSPGYFPIQIEMRHRARRPHHIERSVASNLISDAHIIAARVFVFGSTQPAKSSPRSLADLKCSRRHCDARFGKSHDSLASVEDTVQV